MAEIPSLWSARHGRGPAAAPLTTAQSELALLVARHNHRAVTQDLFGIGVFAYAHATCPHLRRVVPYRTMTHRLSSTAAGVHSEPAPGKGIPPTIDPPTAAPLAQGFL